MLQRNVRSVQVPLEVGDESYGVWCTLAVDLPALLKSCSQIAFKCLRGFQICANLTVRSIFTSNILSTSEVDLNYHPNHFQNSPAADSAKRHGSVNGAQSVRVQNDLDSRDASTKRRERRD